MFVWSCQNVVRNTYVVYFRRFIRVCFSKNVENGWMQKAEYVYTRFVWLSKYVYVVSKLNYLDTVKVIINAFGLYCCFLQHQSCNLLLRVCVFRNKEQLWRWPTSWIIDQNRLVRQTQYHDWQHDCLIQGCSCRFKVDKMHSIWWHATCHNGLMYVVVGWEILTAAQTTDFILLWKLAVLQSLSTTLSSWFVQYVWRQIGHFISTPVSSRT